MARYYSLYILVSICIWYRRFRISVGFFDKTNFGFNSNSLKIHRTDIPAPPSSYHALRQPFLQVFSKISLFLESLRSNQKVGFQKAEKQHIHSKLLFSHSKIDLEIKNLLSLKYNIRMISSLFIKVKKAYI